MAATESLLTNNAAGTLASGITNVATTVTLDAGQGALFPNPGGGQYFFCTITDGGANIEIVKCTTRATDVLTVVRGQDGTTGLAFSTGAIVELRPVAQMLREKLAVDNGTATNLTISSMVADLAIADGGTGQSTATAAFDALAPTTTQGDIIYHDGTDNVRLAAGTAGQVLETGGAGANPAWANAINVAPLTSDLTTASTAFVDATGCSFTGAANTTYLVELYGTFQSSATTTGIGVGLKIPSGAITGAAFVHLGANTLAHVQQRADDAILGNSTTVATANQNNPVMGWWLVRVEATGGTVQLRWRSETAANTTLKAPAAGQAGTYLTWRKIA